MTSKQLIKRITKRLLGMALQELGSENVEVSDLNEHYSMQVNLYILYNVLFGIKCISGINKDWYEKANETVPTSVCEGVDRVNTDGEYASPAIQYMKVIIDWIYSRPDLFDAANIFVEGFSMNGLFGGMVVFIICIL